MRNTHSPRSLVCLILSLLWLAGCSATPEPVTSTLSSRVTATATALSLPTLLPTLTQAALPTHTIVPTSTLTIEQIEVMTQQLILAAEAGDPASVKRLLGEGADLNGRDAQGRTAVMAATHGNQVEIVRVLIQAGADVNIRDDRLDNPFLYAGAEGLLDILKLTIAAGADPSLTNRFGGTALIPAAERGHIEIIKELLAHTDIDINHVNNLGWTALLEAIILSDGGPRHVEVVRLLVAAGADVNLADAKGVTPLAHAQQQGYTQIVEILQKAGAH